MEKCVIGDTEIDLPEPVVDDFQIFKEVISEETWSNTLSEDEKLYLLSFLPNFTVNDAEEKQKTLKLLFSGANFSFGNPLQKIHQSLKDGSCHPDVVKYSNLCKSIEEKNHEFNMGLYYEKLLRDAIINRQKILDKLYNTSGKEDKNDHIYSKNSSKSVQNKSIHYRVNQRCFEYLKEIKNEAGDSESVSSDDDDDVTLQCYGSPKMFLNNFETFTKVNSTDKEEPEKPKSQILVSNEHFKELMRKHRKRKLEKPDHPTLVTTGLSLDEILERVNFSKKPKTTVKTKNTKQRGMEEGVDDLGTVQSRKDFGFEIGPDVKVESFDQEKDESSSNFFSFLKELICTEHKQSISLSRLEEKISECLNCESVSTSRNAWVTEYYDWIQLLLPALKFLSGELDGYEEEHFTPMVCFNEADQTWRWKLNSSCADNDEQLSVLYYRWMERWNSEELRNSLADLAAPVPPPRMYTSYVVQPSTNEDKDLFRAQEEERFTNPHKAFTYIMHGYESTVGPIKGMYNKENSMIKAREHALLIKDRPPCVNILTLVHDSAARMPNGEGTRSDICELFKDSQFLAPGVSDAQINTVVSGALDRLHYEKDPCVKYDNSRKLWIYRHRHRTEAEFEKIHQIQRTVTRAKKVILPKKGSLSKLQMSIAKKDGVKHQGKLTSLQSTIPANLPAKNVTSTVSSPGQKFMRSPPPPMNSPPHTLAASSSTSSLLRQQQPPPQHVHTVLQLPDGSIIKASAPNRLPNTPVRVAKASIPSSAEKVYSLLSNKTVTQHPVSFDQQPNITIPQAQLPKPTTLPKSTPLSSLTPSSLKFSPLKTDASQLKLISQLQQQLLLHQQQKQLQTTILKTSLRGLAPVATNSSVVRPLLQSPTSIATLVSNQKIQIPNFSTAPKVANMPSSNYVSQLLKGNTIVLPSSLASSSTASITNLSNIFCVSIANSSLAQLNSSNLIRNQANTGSSGVRVLSLPTRLIVPEHQQQRSILLTPTVSQAINQTLLNPSALYLTANVHNKPVQGMGNPGVRTSIIGSAPSVNSSISLLSPGEVRLTIMRPRGPVATQQERSIGQPQMLQARLPASLQGFLQIINRANPPSTSSG